MHIEMNWGEGQAITAESIRRNRAVSEIINEVAFLAGEDPIGLARLAPTGKGRKALEWMALATLTFEELSEAVSIVMRYSKNPDDVTALLLCLKAEIVKGGKQNLRRRLEQRIREGVKA